MIRKAEMQDVHILTELALMLWPHHNASVIEDRLDDSGLTAEMLIQENEHNLERCIAHSCEYILIDQVYEVDLL